MPLLRCAFAVLAATVSASAAPTSPSASSVRIEPARVTTVVVRADAGRPVERALPSRAYAAGVEADADMRWGDSERSYREASADWTAAARLQPSAASELAIAKADRERQRSQLLASIDHLRPSRAAEGGVAPERPGSDALAEGKLLRAKLMAVRAYLGRVPPGLYSRTRDRLREALRRTSVTRGSAPAATPAAIADIHLLLCATYAVGGELEAARSERAQVGEGARASPALDLSMATCDAALGDADSAIARLELVALNPGGGARVDEAALRDIYIANDWDRLRDDPRFERLFRR